MQASSLYKRLQWLEQRLERLLLSRKRGRPGVRGRREHPQKLVSVYAKYTVLGTLYQKYNNNAL